MRTVMRWFVIVVVVVHGLIHLLVAVRGFGWADVPHWADVPQLSAGISIALGAAWFAAAALVIAAGVLLVIRVRWWWVVGAVAVVISQGVIVTSWTDAKVGTVANVVLLAAVVYGYASQGPTSQRAEYRRRVNTALARPLHEGVVTEADLAHLPGPVATYVRRSDAVGQPRITNLHARMHGRIRAGATSAWMSFTGEQVNTFSPGPSRLFFMDATMFGLPVDVLHTYVGPCATMRVKACSLVPMVNAAGPNMDRAETVTLFNDLCLLAPGALINAPIMWLRVDSKSVRGVFFNGAHAVTADLFFDDDGDLVEFVSHDRLRSSRDGKSFTPQRWSTPVRDYRTASSRRVSTRAEARWHAPDPEGEFAYLEFNLDEITYNVPNSLTVPGDLVQPASLAQRRKP